MNDWMEGWEDRWMDKLMDGLMDGIKDGRTDKQVVLANRRQTQKWHANKHTDRYVCV